MKRLVVCLTAGALALAAPSGAFGNHGERGGDTECTGLSKSAVKDSGYC